ncbi:MAG TPA: hypothetical protein VEY30_12525 [Myxococcaceae bacterium]|nr:hypothetical protein [Myxococcaceae bacterium]
MFAPTQLRASGFQRALALAVAALWLAAPLLSTWHLADHTHRFCSEHGAFEEVEGDADANPSDGSVRVFTADASPTEGIDSETHQACAFLGSSHRPWTLFTAVEEVQVLALEVAGISLGEHSANAQIAPLVASPKASPPKA